MEIKGPKPKIQVSIDPDTGYYVWINSHLKNPFLGFVKYTTLQQAMFRCALRIGEIK